MTSNPAPLDAALSVPTTTPMGTPAGAPMSNLGARGARRFVTAQPLGAVALVYLVVIVALGVFAPLLASHPPGEQDLSLVLAGPSNEHWLGTDTLGRDVFSRLLHGINPSLTNSAIALTVFVMIGVPLGILAGYRGGWVDAVISRSVELVIGIPAIIVVLVVLGVFASSAAAMLALGVLSAPGLIRVVRGVTLIVREEPYVIAARVSGLSPARIMGSHVLRRALGPILVQMSVFAGVSLAFQSALAFLGLLSSGGKPAWGGMIAEASTVITTNAALLLPPGVALGVTVLAFGVLGDAIRDLTSDQRPSRVVRRARRTPPPAILPVKVEAAGQAGESIPLLRVGNLTVTAGGKGGIPLVHDVSFDVSPGRTVALVGESGCGKSMTALALLGLLPAGVEVTNGSVYYAGQDLQHGGAAAYRGVRGSGVAYVAQDALGSLDPTHTVGSHLREVIRHHDRLSAAQTRERAAELLLQVNLTDTARVLASYPHEISGGMAQRINIALALAGRPQVLIADEPTTALDVTVQAEILALLRELQQSTNMAILMITHDWGVVADLAHEAVVMYAGEVVEQAPVEDIFATPRFPYTAALLAADPSTAHEGARLPALPGRVPPPGAWPRGCHFAGRCAHRRAACTAGELPLIPLDAERSTRCIRVDELVVEGVLPR